MLPRSTTEDNGDELLAYILHIFMAIVFSLVLVLSSCAAWLQKGSGSKAVAAFYSCSVGNAILSVVLFAYRAHLRVAGLRTQRLALYPNFSLTSTLTRVYRSLTERLK